MEILVVGSVAYDGVTTPFDHRDRVLGGSATFFALAAQHFGKVNLVAVVGQDFQSEDRELLDCKNIDLEGLETKAGKSFFWRGKYLPGWNERITLETQLNVFEHFEPKLPERYRRTPLVFLGNIAPVLQNRVLDQMEQPQLVALDTMNLWIDTARNELLRVLKRVDILLVNDSEAQMLSGKTQIADAARAIMDLGPQSVCIKKGEHGALLFQGDEVFAVPAYPLCKVVDPTGAGDSFAGGFMGYLSVNSQQTWENMKRAMVYGSIMGSFTVESFSVERCAAVSDQDIRARYQEFVTMTHFHG